MFDNQVRHTSRRECAGGGRLTGKGGVRSGRGFVKLLLIDTKSRVGDIAALTCDGIVVGRIGGA